MATPKDPFVHLHNHSTFSMLDGHSMVDDMAKEVARLGQPAVAVTDHGNMHAVIELQRACDATGVQPIFGLEAYMAPTGTTRHSREPHFYARSAESTKDNGGKVEGSNDVSGGGTYTHMTLLARNNAGLHNLFRFVTKTFTEGYYRKNRGDLELLEEYSEGIIATTGCPSGEIQTRLRLGQKDKAYEYAAQVRDIVGKENYFVELMNHDMGIDLERKVIPELLELARKLGIPLLATNDAHYVKQEDYKAHEYMLAMQTGSYMSEKPYDEGGTRFAFSGQGYYLKSYSEMARIFPESDFPGALSNTLLVAEMAQGTRLDYDDTLRPSIDIPAGHTVETFFEKEVYDGLAKRRGGADKITEEERERIGLELSVIIPKDYVQYFLVVSDFVRWSKRNGILVGPGRGSVGGSLVAFALDISELDPMRYPTLLFERFLNPERDSPPDVDLDYPDVSRDRAIRYITEKYGKDNVAHVATFTKVGVKTGIKDAARILEEPYSLGDALSKKIPPADAGKEMTFDNLLNPDAPRYEEAGDFRDAVNELGAHQVIEVARSVEGRVKTTGVHAAGIIISSKKISDHIPMMMRQKDQLMITQFDYPTCESLGLLKVDFLGLRNLSIIQNALDNIKKNRGIELSMDDIIHGPMDDEKTYKLLQKGQTLGVFQLDSGGMRDLLRHLKPTDINDISAVLALYRPGPMGMQSHEKYARRKWGLEPVEYPHPELAEPLKEILGATYGIAAYQEQVMQIAQKIANYSLAQADNLRRAMGKKKKEILDAEFPPFREGALKNGYSEEAINTLWNVLIPFSEYGFNYAHSAGYGLLSYVTAFLKANYTSEYMAALITSVFDDKDTLSLYLQECLAMGLKVVPPDVNSAGIVAAPKGEDTVVFGLSGISGISADTAQLIVDARESEGEFSSLFDFLDKVPAAVLNKSVMEGLTLSGAFDAFGATRRAVVAALPDLLKTVRAEKRASDKGQDSLFDGLDEDIITYSPLPEIEEFPKQELLSKERAALGLYLSDHPLSGLSEALATYSDTSIADILSGQVQSIEGFASRDTPRRTLAGVVVSITKKRTRKGDEFAIVVLEDLTGFMEMTMFSRTLNDYRDVLAKDRVFAVTGVPRIREAGAVPTFTVDRMVEIEMTHDGRSPFMIRLHEAQATEESIGQLKETLMRHTGESPVRVYVKDAAGGVTAFALPETLSVKPSITLRTELHALFGMNSLGRW